MEKEKSGPIRTITHKGTSVYIYQTPTQKKGKSYDGYTLTYTQAGQRKRQVISKLSKAIETAREIAEQLSQGTGHTIALTPQAVADYTAALQILRKYPDIPLASVCQQYADALDRLGEHGTLTDAVSVFMKVNSSSKLPEITVANLVEKFFEDKEKESLSNYYLVDLKRKLKRFSSAFQCNISSIQPQEIKQWIMGSATTKSFRNLHTSVGTLFSFARAEGYLPEEGKHAAERVIGVKAPPLEIGIYTPSELSKILRGTEKRLIPSIAIAAFAGIRSAEIFRLDWSDIKLDQGHIEVNAQNAKTALRRIVPILPALNAWLLPHIKKSGRITPEFANLDNLTRKYTDICKAVSVTQHRNGFRHSFASYRLAIVESADKVSLEMGNSPRKLFTNYRELVTKTEANEWFAVFPTSKRKSKPSPPVKKSKNIGSKQPAKKSAASKS